MQHNTRKSGFHGRNGGKHMWNNPNIDKPYVIIYETRNIAYREIERHLEDYLVECDSDCVPGDIIDNKIVMGFGMVNDDGFKCGEKVVAIPLNLIQDMETSNQNLEEYGFEVINIHPLRGQRYRNRNPY